MARSADALITPELLVWARETAGYSKETIASKMKIPIEKLKDWEEGKKHPTIKQLRRLANYYKRPLAVFFLSEKPETIPPLHDFRRIDIEDICKEQIQLRIELRRAIYRREIALELMEELSEKPLEFDHKVNLTDDPEQTAERIRQILHINIDEQFRWFGKYEALNRLLSAIENIGVLVFQATKIDVQEMRGFAISQFPLPVIGLNIKDHPNARIFTLLHELTHLMLHQSGVCDIYEGFNYTRRDEDEKFEVFCNHVAGAALVPKQYLLGDKIVENKQDIENWTNDELMILSGKFHTSREVILRRLLIFGRTTKVFYEKMRTKFREEYREMIEKRNKKELKIKFFRKVLSYNGILFVNLVLDSYYKGNITSNDLSDYLQTKIKHLPEIKSGALNKSIKYGVAL